jgi:hypothetical protein
MNGFAQVAPKTYQTSEKGLCLARELLHHHLQERYNNSPIMEAISIKKQAQRSPKNFVGSCIYFDLHDIRVKTPKSLLRKEPKLTLYKNHENLQGEYRIIYARSSKSEEEFYRTNETFTPSSERSITVKTHVRQTEPGTPMNAAFREGCWAGVEVVFNKESMCLGLDNSVQVPNGVPARLIQPPTPNGNSSRGDPTRLDKVLELGVNGSGVNNVYFGMKKTQEDFDCVKEKAVVLGFEFLELELDCVDPDYGWQDLQIIIAVKLSNEVKDVGSPFLLMQQIQLPRDCTLYQLHVEDEKEEWEDTYL